MQLVRRLSSFVLTIIVMISLSLISTEAVKADESAATTLDGFDHDHQLWDKILKETVIERRDGRETVVDYGKVDKATLQKYLDQMLAQTKRQVDAMSREQRLAYYINLYNALTVQFILTKYPNIKSIKELGGRIGFIPNPLSTPWKQKFFTLFGEKQDLDTIEHVFIRGAKDYDEPRIHFAVNCASIGCPALMKDAFTAAELDTQLETATINFLRDQERNRVNTDRNRIEVSPIFRWYREDFEQGHRGYTSLEETFAKYAEHLSDDPKVQEKIKAKEYDIGFTAYDWGLNDSRGRGK